MKACRLCKINKELDEFPVSKESRSGRRSECKCCIYYRKKINKIKSGTKFEYFRFVSVKSIRVIYLSKTCTTCGTIKDMSEFSKRNDVKDQRASVCKLCRNTNVDKKLKSTLDKHYYESNREKVIHKVRKYRRENVTKITILSAKYRAKKVSATPSWLTEEQLLQIDAVYHKAKELEIKTGTPHQVDHIVPLNSPLVCGLHVPWNLRAIPAQENISKGNKVILEVINGF